MGYSAEDMIEAANVMGRLKKMNKTNSKHSRHEEICKQLNELYITKNKEYGDSFGKAYKELGSISGVADIYHKVQRLLNITKNNQELKYESVEDTLRDLANYSIMLLVEMELDND